MHTQNEKRKKSSRVHRGPTKFPRSVEFARIRGRSYTHLYRCLMGERGGPLAAEYHAWYAERQELNRKFASGPTANPSTHRP